MKQILDDGKTVAFGQDLGELESLFSCTAADYCIRTYRRGIDKVIREKNLSLDFDSGRLKKMSFLDEYQFINPLTPYPEQWRNFRPLDDKKIHALMSQDEFLSYLDLWHKEAENSGAKKVDFGDMESGQYAVSHTVEKNIDMLSILMGPTRRAGGGGIWCDTWGMLFSTEADFEAHGKKPGLLRSISTFRDEFNTVARKK